MWKLNRIKAENICAFTELDYTLSQGVTTLVFGDNCDNESQRSNGSGKSALLECIAIGITGSPLRKIKNDEIINDAANASYVMLEFSNNSCSEIFTVERELFRKGASVVRCKIERDGKLVDTDEAVQHSVDAYTKYILDKLGVTRDELFNNFILSKHRYEDFLSCSDKEKKDIINRFSNGIVVDEAITRIEGDIAPIEEELHRTELDFASIEGRIEMLVEQIEKEENSKEERNRSKVERIRSIEQTITEKRDALRGLSVQADANAEVLVSLNTADNELQLLEHSDESLEVCISGVKMVLKNYGKLSDWNAIISEKQGDITKIEQEQKLFEQQTSALNDELLKQQSICATIKADYDNFVANAKTQSEEYKKQLADLEKELNEANIKLESLREKRMNHSRAIEELNNKIAGVVTCPKCGFEFLTSCEGFDVEVGRGELSQLQTDLKQTRRQGTETEKTITFIEQDQKEIQQSRRKLNTDNSEWLSKVDAADKELQSLNFKLESQHRKERQVADRIASAQKEIDNTRRKLFDEAYEIIDTETRNRQRTLKLTQEDIASVESSIETLYTTIGEINNSSPDSVIESLKESLKEARKRSSEALKAKESVANRLSRLTEQVQRFAQFKSFLANTKIEALSKITNEFLESIGSDIRIQFSGYTVLKTGKVREKISVSLVRDGVDCGSFGKFSEGEKARVNISSILAMQKLVNSNCDDTKGLDLLVLDEILAAVDEEGNAKMFESINRLGITALVVSHGHTSESYPHTLTIRKENGRSYIV